jgi:di/tricarboxylate transporter
VMAAGIIYMILMGRRLLPRRDIGKELSATAGVDLGDFFALEERLFILELPEDSSLVRKTLAESRLGAALGLNVIAVIGDGGMQLAPAADTVLQPGQKLLASGRLDRLEEISDNHFLRVEEEGLSIERLFSQEVILAEVELNKGTDLVGQTVEGARLRERLGFNLLAVNRGGVLQRTGLRRVVFELGDILLIQGTSEQLEAWYFASGLPVEVVDQVDVYRLQECLFALQVPPDSILVGKSLGKSHLRDAFGLSVLGITRQGETHLLPTPDVEFMVGDILLVEGKPEDISALRGLQELEMGKVSDAELSALETERVGMAEVVLSPHSNLAGKTLRQIHFREKYGLSVLAIWREGRAYRSNLRDSAIKFAYSLLAHGLRQKLILLGGEPDFLVLTQSAQQVQRTDKAPLALAVMLIVLLPVIFGALPIVITAVLGAILMVLTGSLTMEEAYRSIEWKAIFLIAGVLPLGLALERTGAANLLADGIVSMVGAYGPLAVTAGLFILAALSSQVMPNPAVAVLLAPIAYNTARDLGISPYPLLMTVAVSASAAFLSPVGHAANVLIMGPGGYRFKDYLKVGLPLTLVVLVLLLLVLPVFWPY